jgi:hypothetical protein
MAKRPDSQRLGWNEHLSRVRLSKVVAYLFVLYLLYEDIMELATNRPALFVTICIMYYGASRVDAWITERP